MGKSQSKNYQYDTPVFCLMRKAYGFKCMRGIEGLIKYHDFPIEGTLSVTRLTVVKDSVVEGREKQKGCCCAKHVCVDCKPTILCWLEEAERRERKSMQKELPCRKVGKINKNEGKPINPSPVLSVSSPPPYLYPVKLQVLKMDPDLDCSPPNLKPLKPMIDVAGPEDSIMIFRPWTLTEIQEAMAHLPRPSDSGERFSESLTIFCQVFSPTLQELRRLLPVELGATDWHKVSGKVATADIRRKHPEWENPANDGYRAAISDLANAFKAAFPIKIDMSKINNCCQGREESVQDYYVRLCDVFNKHSGIEEPKNRGDGSGLWEFHLRICFMDGLRQEITQAVKAKCIDWRNLKIDAVLAHALHAEEQQLTKKEKIKMNQDKVLYLGLTQAVSQWGNNSHQRGQPSGGRRGNFTRKGCFICKAQDHHFRDCTKCRLCKEDGHWAADCPNSAKAN